MTASPDTLTLLLGTIVYRPYVYIFLLCFIVFATYQMGWKAMLTFLISTYLITFVSEYSSTRNGFPFGMYTYLDNTRNRELWISNIPFWDSLSFVFLSYFSFILAAAIQKGPKGFWSKLQNRKTPIIGGFLMMLLDVVIDPLTLQGDKWFLGPIYYYPHEGFYFGVTFANFVGWFLVGLVTQLAFQFYMKHLSWCKPTNKTPHPLFFFGTLATYAGVFLFNLGITIYIKDIPLIIASSLVSFTTILILFKRITKNFKGIKTHAAQRAGRFKTKDAYLHRH